jgi:hypothetical protein
VQGIEVVGHFVEHRSVAGNRRADVAGPFWAQRGCQRRIAARDSGGGDWRTLNHGTPCSGVRCRKGMGHTRECISQAADMPEWTSCRKHQNRRCHNPITDPALAAKSMTAAWQF